MSDEGFVPIWIVIARFMVKLCPRCRGTGWDVLDTCPDCKDLRALVEKAPEGA